MKTSVKGVLRSVIKSVGYEIYNTKNPTVWSEDGLSTIHNFSFVNDPDFKRAYARGIKANDGKVRVPMKPAMHSNSKPAGYSNRKPATLGVNRVGRFDDVVEG